MTSQANRDPELSAALERLFSLQTFGIKLGLEPITDLLNVFGNPHRAFPVVHVAGTNGKGSVSSMIASVLQTTGLRVGLYTSPHLTDFSERIRINGVPIEHECLARYAREMLPVIEERECTFFEGTTAMGFRYFAERAVDIAIIETGMGGRLDATNVVLPIVSVITSIAFDHMKHLGTTLDEIAGEKAGIIKPGRPAVVGLIDPALRPVFQHAADANDAPLLFAQDVCLAAEVRQHAGHITSSFTIAGRTIADVAIDLPGPHQLENARAAITALEAIGKHFAVSDGAIVEGMGAIRANTGLRGRFETVQERPRVILDVAHNPDGIAVMLETLADLAGLDGPIRFVYGAVQDKDVAEIMALLAPRAEHLYAVRANNYRSLDAAEIAERSTEASIPTTCSGDVANAITAAMNDSAPNDTIMICGSFYVVADAIDAIESGLLRQQSGRTMDLPRHATWNYQAFEESSDQTPHDTAASEARAVGYSRRSHGSARPKRSVDEHWESSDRPRERLMRLGPRALSDAELLAILLRTGRAGEDVMQVSRNILARFEGLSRLLACHVTELQQIAGIGPTKAVTLAAAFEIGARVEAAPFTSRPLIRSAEDVANIYIPLLRGVQKEQFHVLPINSAGQVIRMELVSEGTLNGAVVHPREVFRTAIVERAAGVIVLHNHPSGNPRASNQDIEITRQLIAAGHVLGIPLHDHVIIAGEQYLSMVNEGLI